MLFKLFVNMCISSWAVLMVLMASSIALSLARKMFWYPDSLSAI